MVVPVELGSPNGLWLLGLLVPLALLYVLKIRRERVRVGSVWLWQTAQRDLLARSPFQRLRRHWLLILEALALLALGLGLARPLFRDNHIDSEHVALVIDTSASLGAREADGVRLDAARSACARVLASLRPGADVLLIDAGAEPRVVAPADRDLKRVSSFLQRLTPSGEEGRLAPAIALASEQLSQRAGSRRIVVVTDDGGLAEPLPKTRVPLSVVRVGHPADNVGIVRVEVGRATPRSGEPDRTEAFAEVQNFGATARELFVTLTLRNSPTVLASRKLRLEAREKAQVVLGFDTAPSDAGAGLVVSLSPGDSLAIDDRAYGRVPPNRKLTAVLAPGKDSPWLERALLADPEIELFRAPLADVTAESVPDDALVVVHGACPPELPGGDFVIVNPPPGPCWESVVQQPVEAPSITSWERTDPRLRFISFDGVSISSARPLDPPSAQSVLLRGRDGALMVDASSSGRTGTIVGFDVGESTWPLRASFVLFVRNIAEIARQHRASRVVGPARAGAPLRVRVPAGVERVALTDPSGAESTLEVRGGVAIVPSPRIPGFYSVSYRGRRAGSALSVVNLTSARESDLRPTALAAGSDPVTEDARAGRGAVATAGDLGYWGAALALVCVSLQVLWLTRRPRPLDTNRIQPALPNASRKAAA